MSKLSFEANKPIKDGSLPGALGIDDKRALRLIQIALSVRHKSLDDPRFQEEHSANSAMADVLSKLSHEAQTPEELAYLCFFMASELTEGVDPANVDNYIRG